MRCLALAPLLEAASADLWRGVATVTLADLPRWETRGARRAASEAQARAAVVARLREAARGRVEAG